MASNRSSGLLGPRGVKRRRAPRSVLRFRNFFTATPRSTARDINNMGWGFEISESPKKWLPGGKTERALIQTGGDWTRNRRNLSISHRIATARIMLLLVSRGRLRLLETDATTMTGRASRSL